MAADRASLPSSEPEAVHNPTRKALGMSAMFDKARDSDGFIAALDQSGGSTPKALRLYGVDDSEYSGDEEMFDKVHEMRTRIMTSPSFGGDRILGAILSGDDERL